MRRPFVAAIACCALLAVGSATALARHDHHPRHHARHHDRRPHARRHDERFGPAPGTPAPATQDAGTVMSFTGGMLTIKLDDGSTVSGTVNGGTEIECEGMQNDVARDGGPGPSGGGDNNGDNGDTGDQGDHGDDDGDQVDANDDQSCATTALVAGATVRDAQLSVSSAGSIWTRIDLES
jgi:hypothetical protein